MLAIDSKSMFKLNAPFLIIRDGLEKMHGPASFQRRGMLRSAQPRASECDLLPGVAKVKKGILDSKLPFCLSGPLHVRSLWC